MKRKDKENRIKRVTIRFTEKEYDTLIKHASEYKNVSDMIRKLILDKFKNEVND